MRKWIWPPPIIGRINIIGEAKEDGLACQDCRYVVRELRRIKKHYRERHRWINPRKRGRYGDNAARPEEATPWRTGVRCQRFFPSRVASGWFEIARDELSDSDSKQADGMARKAAFLERVHQEDDAKFESEAKSTIQDANDKWEAERWLSRCG